MNSKFNINRVGSLIRYDWMLGKNTLTLTLTILALLYASLMALVFVVKGTFSSAEELPQFPMAVATMIVSYFQYGLYALTIAITTLLTAKYCNPKTSTTYLALPGNTSEKYVTLLFDYFFGFIAYTMLYLVLFYLTMGVGALVYPQLDWCVNGVALLSPSNEAELIQRMFDLQTLPEANPDLVPLLFNEISLFQNTMFWINLPSNLAFLAFYLVLVLCFRTNSQLKAIGILFLIYLVIVISMSIGLIGYIIKFADQGDGEQIIQTLIGFFSYFRYGIIFFTILGLGFYWVLYRQLALKQAK